MTMAAALLGTSPVLVPLVTALLAAMAGGRPRLQAGISFGGCAVFLACGVALVALASEGSAVRVAFGGWPTPFGIEFAIDRLGAALVLITALMGAATVLFLASDVDRPDPQPLRLPLVHGLLAGVGGAFATADLFNLYVWFEVMLICSVGLLALGGRLRQLDGTLKYLALSLIGTLLLLVAVVLFYGATGHLNYGALAQAASGLPPALLLPLLSALLLALLVKAGVFPLFSWLPASYHTLPAALLALFAALLTKVGVYAVLRVLGDVFAPAPALLYEALGWVAAVTMLIGVIGAAYHWDMRRILAFHIISQIGYILLGVALGTAAGNTATIFYTVHHILVKGNLFLIAALIFRSTGHYDLRRIGGLYARRPWLSVLFGIPALSLVGVPPLSGFWAKFLVLQEALGQGRVVWTAIALLVSVLTLYSMMKIWMEAFWKEHPDPDWEPPTDLRLAPAHAATIGLAALTLAISLWPQALIGYAHAAAGALGGGG